MSIFDVLTNGSMGSVLDSLTGGRSGGGLGGLGGSIGSALESIGAKAKSAATNIRDNTPGGIGGLAGAGAIGALLGNVFSGDIMKSVALAGAGAVAWNFYKKWAAQKNGQAQQDAGQMPAGWGDAPSGQTQGWTGGPTAPALGIDPTAELVLRSMVYAARADGQIDKEEQERIDEIMKNMLPGQDVSGAMQRIRSEVIDPNKIAAAVGSPEQAEDVYRLSCAVIDIDHFMELGYTQTLAKALGIDDARKRELESEAEQAKRQLMASVKS